jgi:choice-of-anchor A domain-containing protein
MLINNSEHTFSSVLFTLKNILNHKTMFQSRLNQFIFVFCTLSTFSMYAQVNPTARMEGFQIMTQNNFTISGNAHVHGSAVVGGNMTLNASFIEINKDNVGTYTCPGDDKPTGLMVKGRMIWTAGQGNLQNQKYIHIGDSTGTDAVLYNNSFTKIQSEANTSISVTMDVRQTSNVFGSDALDVNSAFSEMTSLSSQMSIQANNVTLSGSAPNYSINSLINGTNYLKLTQAQYSGMQGLNFNVRPTANKVMVITIPLTSNLTLPSMNLTGLQNEDAKYILFNFVSTSSKTITMSTANLFIGTIYAPLHTFNKTGTGNVEGGIAAKTVTFGTGEWHVQPFSGNVEFAPLPVTYSRIEVSTKDDQHIINWATASEYNSAYYIVQRSYDNERWEDIAQVKSSNVIQGDQYTAKFKMKQTGNTYYRINQIDLDGASAYSDIVGVFVQDITNHNITIYPNPATDIITLSALPIDGQITIFNAQGQKVHDTKASLSVSIDISNLINGQYIVYIAGHSEPKTYKLLVQR